MANKTYEQKIDTFTGGMANDVREKDLTKYAYTKGLDTFSYKHRMVPYRSYEAGNDTLTRRIFNFVRVSGNLYGLGGATSDGLARVYTKTTFTDGTWVETGGNNAATNAEQADPGSFFVYYGNTGLIYGVSGTGTIFGYTPGGGAAWQVNTIAGVNLATNGAFALVHSKDDILYVGAQNKILSKNGTASFNAAALTLPVGYVVTSLAEYGNYLAIACVNNDTLTQKSKVFLWDRDTSLTTLSETIDWGEGSLNILEELEGRLIGISVQVRASATNLLFNSIVSFKYYAGAQGAIEFARLTGRTASNAVTLLGKQKQKANNRIYFPMILTMPEGVATREGIWSLGKNLSGQYAITCEYQSSDATVPNTIDGFFLMGSYIFIAYSNSGTLSGNISKTDDTENYTNTSTYESVVFDGGDVSLNKKLIGVTVYTLALPSGATVTLKYKIDDTISDGGATAFTTIFSNTTLNSLSHSAINIESNGNTLPEWNELQFQILSTGGAIITGLSFAYELVSKRIY